MRSVVVQPEATQETDDAFGWYCFVHSVFHCSRNPVEWQSRLTPLKKIL
jgi:hypothetical protein